MSYYPPSPGGAPPFSPTTYRRDSIRSPRALEQRQSSIGLVEQGYPMRPVGDSRQPFPIPGSSTRSAQYPYYGDRLGCRVHLSTPSSIQDEFIHITFPRHDPGDRNCPFRLVDCWHFLQTGLVAVWQFDQPSLQATVEIPQFRQIDKSVDKIYDWVAVSYDDSDTRELRTSRRCSEDGRESRVAQYSPIRRDVLMSLCNVATQKFGVGYLWLDKLCVFQNSATEVGRWNMPGNVKWAFGLAKGTLVLLNGLSKALPERRGDAYDPKVLAHTSDLMVSLRVFLEIAFNDNLKRAVIPFRGFHESHRKQGYPSAEMDHRAAMPPGYTMPLKGFLETLALDMRSLLTVDSAVGRTLELDESDLNRVNNLLSLLSSRDKIKHPQEGFSKHSEEWHEEISNWEVAIWRSVLLDRKTNSCGQLVFGLSFLLQDLCNAQGKDSTGSALVSCIWNALRPGLDDDTGEAKPDGPLVYDGFACIVRRFNQISQPTAKLVEILKEEGPWNVPLLPEWISFDQWFSRKNNTIPREYNFDNNQKFKGAIASLRFSAIRHVNGHHDILALDLKGLFEEKCAYVANTMPHDSEHTHESNLAGIPMGLVWMVPAKVFCEEPNMFFIVFLELELGEIELGEDDTLKPYWLVKRFSTAQEWSEKPSPDRIVLLRLTPDGEMHIGE